MGRRWLLVAGPTLLVLAGWGLYQVRPGTALLWGLGALLGVALHRSRFCVAAAFEDTVLFHDTGTARALLLALGLSLVGFGWLQHQAMATGEVLPGNIYPVSPATVVGALLFGIGIVPAGGCTITTVVRLGEGHLRFGWTLLGLLLGSQLGAWQYGWWLGLGQSLKPVHLPSVLGWGPAVALEAALLLGLYGLLCWWERKGAYHP